MKNKINWVCIWLGIIAAILLAGVLFIAAYVYKFDPLSPISEIFKADAGVDWTAVNALATIAIGIASFIINSRLESLQVKQAEIEKEQHNMYIKQHQLLTEPHILVDSIQIQKIVMDISEVGTELKTIKGVDYPYYSNIHGSGELINTSLISITVVNTSEAFARVRVSGAKFITYNNNSIAEYNGTTFGVHENHLMLGKNGSGKIGLVIDNELLDKLRGTKFTLSVFLDNNFQETFKDTQHYHIVALCDDKVSFMPRTMKENTFEAIHEEKTTQENQE